jgi:hypothetical protein
MAERPAEILTTACGMELLRVETADGRFLGHVFDLRCRWNDEGAPVLEEVLFGRRGWLERVGLMHGRPRSLHWHLVEGVRGNVIVVAASKR